MAPKKILIFCFLSSILDVHAVDAEGRQFDIEIQVRSQQPYVKRSLYYLSRMYGFQLCKGDKYELLEPYISINILDFALFPDKTDFHHFFTLREYENRDHELSQDISVNYLQLPKFFTFINARTGMHHAPYSLNLIEQWSYLIKEIDNEEDPMVQTIINTTPELDRTSEEYKRFMTNQELRWEAESHDKWLHDQAQYKYEAIQEGKAEGKTEGIRETTTKMLLKGLDISLIAEITGLTAEEIQKLN